MNDALLILTAGALAGLASKPGGGHVDPHPAADIAKRAVELGAAALAALEEHATEPTKPPAKAKR